MCENALVWQTRSVYRLHIKFLAVSTARTLMPAHFCLAVSTARTLTLYGQLDIDAQVLCTALIRLGCILPSEPTSASVSAACLVAQHGGNACMLSDAAIDNAYQSTKKRMKDLYKSEPALFMQSLPATPADLVRQHRDFALTLFDREHPPVVCPLNMLAMRTVESRVSMRGGGKRSFAAGGHFGISCIMGSGVDRLYACTCTSKIVI